ncbi:MAG: hypothetical protein ACYCQI_16155 [Gammaproteobacteria bacterium]
MSLRQVLKSNESKMPSMGLPDDIIEYMIPMMWFKEQKALATTSKTASFWVARHLLAELVDLFKIKDVSIPDSLQEVNNLYRKLLLQKRGEMHRIIFDTIHDPKKNPLAKLDERYIKHLCQLDKKFGGYMLFSMIKPVGKERLSIASKFINYHADVNWRNESDGYTPLLAAIRVARENRYLNMVNFVKQLLAAGADITVKGKDGKSALKLAKGTRIEAVLLEHIKQKQLASVSLNKS